MENSKPILFIFDLNSHIYRSYHSALKNKEEQRKKSFYKGYPNYIVRGVLSLIEKEIDELKLKNIIPTHFSIILDDDGENFRHELYSKYKENRTPPSKELVFMRNCIYKLLHLKGYNTLRIKDVEADDVLATIAKKASKNGFKTYIFSKDKDLFQLVDDNTFIYNGSEKKVYDADTVKSCKGVYPEKILDYLTILGDKADNIQGIPRVGQKTCVKILERYTLDDILENPEKLIELKINGKEKIIEYIKENKDFIILMKKLVKLKDDLNLNSNFKDFIKKEPNIPLVVNAFNSLGLKYL